MVTRYELYSSRANSIVLKQKQIAFIPLPYGNAEHRQTLLNCLMHPLFREIPHSNPNEWRTGAQIARELRLKEQPFVCFPYRDEQTKTKLLQLHQRILKQLTPQTEPQFI